MACHLRAGQIFKGFQVIENYDFGDFGGLKPDGYGRPMPGDLGLTFRILGAVPGAVEISRWGLMWGTLISHIDLINNMVKSLLWLPVNDPLIIDLDGDGIETVAQSQSGVHFDLNGDFFAESAGWVSGDDGFVVWDRNANGNIDDITEVFGGPDRSGFAHLATNDNFKNTLRIAA